MATRVWLSHTLTISGGMWLRPFSYPRRRLLPSTATTPCVAPSPNSARNAVMKAVKALANSVGSSSRNRRLNVSWLGAPYGSSTISDSSSSRSRQTPPLPHSSSRHTASQPKSKTGSSRRDGEHSYRADRALLAESKYKTASSLLDKRKALTESFNTALATSNLLICDSPAPCGEGLAIDPRQHDPHQHHADRVEDDLLD